MATAAGDKAFARQAREKIDFYRKKYDELCEKTGLQPMLERMGTVKAKTLTGAGGSGIIKKGLRRNTKNLGAFSVLSERMTKSNIRNIAKKYGFNIRGLTLNIDMNEELLNYNIAGEAVPEAIGRITFFPNAFSSEEEVLRTLVHEREHVKQYREYGIEYVQNNRIYFEKLAYKAENDFIEKLKIEGKL